MKTRFLISAVLLLLCSGAHALTEFQKISAPADCPKNLQITSRTDSKDADFVVMSVRFKPRESNRYKGRIKATCWLDLANDGQILLKSELKTTVKAGFTTCSFRIHGNALRGSRLNVSSHPFEKDGEATVGGGAIYEVHLAGWANDTSEKR